MTPVVTMRQLLESGVHFGHQTRRWNPKMKRFIFTERNGIYIIDLQQSLDFIDRAYEFIKETVAHGGSVLYVGTKKQAQEAIAEQARRVGMPFVNQRWLGGMLTNFTTVYKRLQRLKELEEIDFDDVAGSALTKKELLQLRRERDKLERSLGGIRDMSKVPSALWVVDTKKEHIAVSEARKLGIPVIAILDTNCDPDEVTYPIPGNDDAIRSVALLTRVVADAVADGLIARAGAAAGEEKPSALGGEGIGAAEPLAEWERALLEGREQNGTEVPAPGLAAPAAAAPAPAAAAANSAVGSAPAAAGNAATTAAGTGPAETGQVEQPSAGRPATGQPAAGQPADVPPAAGRPAAGQPTAGQPSAGRPAPGQPAAGQPAAGQSTAGQPAPRQPAAGQPAAGQSTAGQPAPGESATGQPADSPLAAEQASGVQAAAAQAAGGQQAAGEQAAGEQPAASQPADVPPAAEQASGEQPAASQPADVPPAAEQASGVQAAAAQAAGEAQPAGEQPAGEQPAGEQAAAGEQPATGEQPS